MLTFYQARASQQRPRSSAAVPVSCSPLQASRWWSPSWPRRRFYQRRHNGPSGATHMRLHNSDARTRELKTSATRRSVIASRTKKYTDDVVARRSHRRVIALSVCFSFSPFSSRSSASASTRHRPTKSAVLAFCGRRVLK